MRLIDVHTLVISEFFSNRPPRYAILSHTWDDEEVTLQDMSQGTAPSLKGYQKIISSCEQARFDGIPYVWIDTCCIDKTSSSELSEAINSMYRWYENATVCYAYLADVGDQDDGMESFKRSRYWGRGWTLQELIAPRILVFFSAGWSRIGNRPDLRRVVSQATSIPTELLWVRNVSDYSVSQKMSWASRRQTTRIEDEAYCLLGLFGVSMPLLYGEGRRAFRRLQEQIIRELDDESIFAWQGGTDHGLLASCPAQFTFSHSIRRSIEPPIRDDTGALPFTITNKGVRISLPVLENCYSVPLYSLVRESSRQFLITDPPHLQRKVQWRVLAILNCQQGTDEGSRIAVILNHDTSRDTYTRDVNIGLVKVSIADITARATMKQVLVASGENPWDGITLMEEDPERLVVVQGLTGVLNSFKLMHVTLSNGIEVRYDLQQNSTISIRFRQQKPLVVTFRSEVNPSHHLVLYLRSSEEKTRAYAATTQLLGENLNKDDIIVETAQFGQDFLLNNPLESTVYETRSGTYTLSLDIREAEHASVVTINAQPRDTTTTIT